jgi:hypothetical protein
MGDREEHTRVTGRSPSLPRALSAHLCAGVGCALGRPTLGPQALDLVSLGQVPLRRLLDHAVTGRAGHAGLAGDRGDEVGVAAAYRGQPELGVLPDDLPTAALMVALAALAEARLVYSTTYSVAPVICWVAALLAGDWLRAPAVNGTASVSPTIAASAPIRSFRTASSSSSSSSSPERPAAPGTPDGAYEGKDAGPG